MQELAFAHNAISLLDLLKERGHFDDEQFERAVGRISFFVNAGIRFVEEMCKMRAFGEMGLRTPPTGSGVTEEKYRRFRYGVQVNSLWGLTGSAAGEQRLADHPPSAGRDPEPQRPLPRCSVARLERGDVAAAALGPAVEPAPAADLAYETDLLEYPICSTAARCRRVQGQLMDEATAEIETILGMAGSFPASRPAT